MRPMRLVRIVGLVRIQARRISRFKGFEYRNPGGESDKFDK